jgi:hypothetical protein
MLRGMGLFTKDGVPRNLLKLVAPSLAPGERVLQAVLLSDFSRAGTDLLAGSGTGDLSDVLAAAPQRIPSWVLVLTDRQVFLFPVRRAEHDPPPTGHPYQQVQVDVGGREIDPKHVRIALAGGEPRRFEVPELWRRQVAVIAAALERGTADR